MKRWSIYASKEAYTQFEEAVGEVLDALGKGTPRHVAVSALLKAAATRRDDVKQELVKQSAAELAARLAALKEQADSEPQP